MKAKRISDLPIYSGDTSGSWLIINSPNQLGTFKIQKEDYNNGDRYIVVHATSNPIDNARELVNAYNKAKTMTPGFGNEVTILVNPGQYDMTNELNGRFTIDSDFINIICPSKQAFIKTDDGSSISIMTIDSSRFIIDGINTNETFQTEAPYGRYINCVGGQNSFNGNGEYKNCRAASYSFNNNGNYENCTAEFGSFGGINGDDASGQYTNCEANDNSFGGKFGIVSGKIKYCETTGAFGEPMMYGRIYFSIEHGEPVDYREPVNPY